jgi:hypothetical protein
MNTNILADTEYEVVLLSIKAEPSQSADTVLFKSDDLELARIFAKEYFDIVGDDIAVWNPRTKSYILLMSHTVTPIPVMLPSGTAVYVVFWTSIPIKDSAAVPPPIPMYEDFNNLKDAKIFEGDMWWRNRLNDTYKGGYVANVVLVKS